MQSSNKLEDFIIKEKLQEEYNKNISKYGNNSIFGTFVIGIANYGFAESVDEIKFVTVYLPTFEELCIGGIKYNEGIYDIRKAYDMALKHSDASLEILYSDYFIINPKYESLWNEYLYKNREKISQVNRKERLLRAYERATAAYEKDDLFEAMRLYIGAKNYANNGKCDKSYHIDDFLYVDLLWNCKNKTETARNLDFTKVFNEMLSFIECVEDEINYNADVILKEGIIKIIDAALHQGISVDAFINNLTDTELKAWQSLKNLFINGTAIVSISKIVEETGISRPVFKNLFIKMEQNKIAIINNMGVKGTEIKLYNKEIIL